ncbi:MAG: glycosyltransferase, partial [Oscillospiraceae bacterium]
MTKKILFVASTFSHIYNFHLPYLNYFENNGYEVHVMANGDASIVPSEYKITSIPFQKSMFSLKNISNTIRIAKIIKSEKYDVVSIHTSLAAFFTRFGIMFSSSRPKLVINTVHGYLFDNKSSFLKRNIMLVAEKMMKPATDIIMVMNQEDLAIAKEHRLYK